mgnify:CR=1 FL=1
MNLRMIIIIAIVILLAGAGAWFYYFQAKSSVEQALSPAQTVIADIQTIERELADLRRLKTIQLDTAVLKDPFLQSLQSPQMLLSADPLATSAPPSRNITPGRPDPFIPF